MSSAVAAISKALGYDACEEILASGGSLATAYALAASRAVVLADESAPISGVFATVPVASTLATVRPAKSA